MLGRLHDYNFIPASGSTQTSLKSQKVTCLFGVLAHPPILIWIGNQRQKNLRYRQSLLQTGHDRRRRRRRDQSSFCRCRSPYLSGPGSFSSLQMDAQMTTTRAWATRYMEYDCLHRWPHAHTQKSYEDRNCHGTIMTRNKSVGEKAHFLPTIHSLT